MPKTVLITGATGKQGGAVINALSQAGSSDFEILAVTRNTNSQSAQKLSSKKTTVKLVQGDLDDVPKLFQNAKEVATGSIWGVYSVQISMGKGVTLESEVKQGCDLIDESVKHGVKHFVYSSVERGGDEKSWDDPTPVDHFKSKHRIEHHLKDNAGQMGWTILRPVAFMDNLVPAFTTKVFLAALHNTLGDKPVQWVATSDIGVFAAKAFERPNEFNHRAIGLAGDEVNYDGIVEATQGQTGATFGLLGSLFMRGVPEMGRMLQWFADVGYKADIAGLGREHPDLLDLKTWVEKESGFQTA